MANIRGSMSALEERLRPSTPTRMRVKIVPSSDWMEDSNGQYLLVDLPGVSNTTRFRCPDGHSRSRCVNFKKEEVRVEVNIKAGHITISGERQVNERISQYFEQIFTLPQHSDVDKITGKFDSEILYVTVPKVVAAVEEQKKEPEIENENVQGSTAAATEPPQVEKNETVEGLRPKDEGEHSKKVDGTKYGEIKKLLGNEHIFFSTENIGKWEEKGRNIVRNAMDMLSKNKGMVVTAVVAFSLGMLVNRKF